jgi:hypothetical protein
MPVHQPVDSILLGFNMEVINRWRTLKDVDIEPSRTTTLTGLYPPNDKPRHASMNESHGPASRLNFAPLY